MRSSLSIALVAFSGLVILACGGSGSDGPPKGGGGTGGVALNCDMLDPAPAGCADSCPSGSDSECGLGTHCLNGSCEAQCTDSQGCDENSFCNVRGRCQMAAGGTGGTGNTGGGNSCQSVTITPTRSIPNVMFLVDQSGSMTAGFGDGEDRWEAAHSAINTIVSDPLDDIVRFGLTTYTSRNGNQNNRSCPRLPTQIDFDLNNSSTFGTDSIYPYSYPSADGEDTPTGDSINALVGLIQADPPPDDGPTIIVLATDGLPDSCECADNYPNPIDTDDDYCEAGAMDPQVEAVNAAAAAHAQQIDVFVLWVGELTSNSTRNHLQDVANAGVTGTGMVWVGDDPASLSNAFQSIIGASISCDVQMDKQFDDVVKACDEGEVRLTTNLGTDSLSCPDDWIPKEGAGGEPDVIQLVGDACTTFKTEASTFSATFPCGAIIVE